MSSFDLNYTGGEGSGPKPGGGKLCQQDNEEVQTEVEASSRGAFTIKEIGLSREIGNDPEDKLPMRQL